jgi:hypothetical protein
MPDLTPVSFGLDFFVLRMIFTGLLFIRIRQSGHPMNKA